MVVFGYSQSARIASIQKANLAAAGSKVPVSFVLIGNPNRPNGGILERFEGLQIPIVGITFDGATPTNTDFKTVDITRQYDGWSDFPNNPLNPFATANAIAGIYYLDGDYQSVGLGDALYQGAYGDTDYYMIPSQRLPLLMPLDEAGVPSPVVTMLDAPARVLVESGYDRTISPGAPTKAGILYFPNPAQTGVNFIVAIPTGIDDGAQEAANIRPFGTAAIDQRSPYGVGGPPVNAGSFDSSGAPISLQQAASVPNTHPLAAPQQSPALPTAPPPAVDKAAPTTPTTGTMPGWWKPSLPQKPDQADVPKHEPLDMPKPLPADMPKPLPVDLPKPASAELPKPAPVDLPTAEIARTDILPMIVPPKIDQPVQAQIPEVPKPVDIPAPAFVPPEIPAAPVAPPVQVPELLPALPAAPLPQLPALPPPMPWLPPPPNIAGILAGIRLPF